jgi:predicted nucleic acid-binding protein
MTVVSDTSVLIHLARIDRFSLLHRIYSEIIIPQEVWRETVEEGSERPGAPETRSARDTGWIEVAAVESDTSVHRLLRRALDDGEATVLALADRKEADLVLLDESAARRRAEGLGLRKTGTVGVILRAKREGFIEEVRPELDALRATSFWIGDPLYRRILEAADEQPE